MKTVAERSVRDRLIERLNAVRPDAPRRWGTLTPHEMLCHLGDAAEMVLLTRPRRRPVAPRNRILVKWIGLWSPVRWPHGVNTNPDHDPRVQGTRPSTFDTDRQRVIKTIHARLVEISPAGKELV
jgi:hypothetical protein